MHPSLKVLNFCEKFAPWIPCLIWLNNDEMNGQTWTSHLNKILYKTSFSMKSQAVIDELQKQRVKDAIEKEELRIQVAALTALTVQAPQQPPSQAQQPQQQQQLSRVYV